ncbi:MAG: hypothetical protein WC539_05455 [Nitrospirota bacterium]
MKNQDNHTKSDVPSGHSLNDHIRDLKPIEYIRTINGYLLKADRRSAYAVAQQAMILYPDEPFILSLYGSLQAVLDKKYRSGVDNCTKALSLLKRKKGTGKEMLYPVLYLNLGRAYSAAGKKRNALTAFKQGLVYDHEHAGLLKEVKKMGTRKTPPLSFLDRSNPVNKLLGKMLGKKKPKH